MKKITPVILLSFLILAQSTFAIEENNTTTKKSFFNFFKRNKTKVENQQDTQNKKQKKAKKQQFRIQEIKLPEVRTGRRPPLNQLSVMTIEDCVEYAMTHNPNLRVSQERINAAEQLKEEALKNEDYEKAAYYRDQIEKYETAIAEFECELYKLYQQLRRSMSPKERVFWSDKITYYEFRINELKELVKDIKVNRYNIQKSKQK